MDSKYFNLQTTRFGDDLDLNEIIFTLFMLCTRKYICFVKLILFLAITSFTQFYYLLTIMKVCLTSQDHQGMAKAQL